MKPMLLVLAAALPAFAQDGKRDEIEAKLRNMRVTLDRLKAAAER